VRGLAADHAAERDEAREAPGLRERERGERKLERSGYRNDGHGLPRDARPFELFEGRREQAGRDLAVELRDEHGNAATPADRRTLEHLHAVWQVERALGVLFRRTELRDLGRLRHSASSSKRRS
jgi:hypothetical protein